MGTQSTWDLISSETGMNRRLIFCLALIALTSAHRNIWTGREGSQCKEGYCNDGLFCDIPTPGGYGTCRKQRHTCRSSQDCGSGRVCNFDDVWSGTCESCRGFKTLNDCRMTGFLTNEGKEECYEVCAFNKGWKQA